MHAKETVTRTAQLAVPLLATAALVTACGSSSGHAARSADATAPAAAGSGASLELTGGHLADGSGRTVYLWEGDHGGTSSCSGACASVWPPVTASGTPTAGSGLTAADLTTVKRTDGRTQLVYAGHPLYYYAGDSAPGQTTGQGSHGFGAAWWEVDASGGAITGASGAATATPTTPAGSSGGGGGGYGY